MLERLGPRPEEETMRVLVTTLHFHPLVPIARALEAAGHEVAFACSEDNRPAVVATGFRMFPCGTSMRALFPRLMAVPEAEREAWAIREAFGRILPERIIPDLLAVGRTWEPDVILRDAIELGGCIVAEHQGLPHASVEVGIFVSAGQAAAWMGDNLQRLRAGLNLPPDPDLQMLYRHLHLSFVPPSYQDPAVPLPPTAHALRTVVFDRSGDETLPARVQNLPARPTVHATLGTGFNRETRVFEAILEGLRDEPINLVVTVGRDQDPARFGPQPPNVVVERYIPQSLLLPHCDLVVSHAGWNTVLSALSHGLPQVLLPIGADQPQNARRCADLEVGRVIGPDRRIPAVIRETVRDVLAEPRYRDRAGRIRAEMQTLPGPEHAVALIERLAATRSPPDDRG